MTPGIHSSRFQWIKPKLVWQSESQQWKCHDDHYMVGHGVTKEEAYEDWRVKEQRRARIPRRGMWNLQGCRRWFKEGCWRIRSYIGHLHIVGYDPTTDELILRG